jgi:hypothetical protein
LADDVRDLARTESSRCSRRTGIPGSGATIAKFANSYAPITGLVTIEGYPFEVLPQFSHTTGELCQALFRAADAEAERIARIGDLLTACYGSPVEGETKRTWWGPATAVELDTVKLSPREERSWLRWYPIQGTEGG